MTRRVVGFIAKQSDWACENQHLKTNIRRSTQNNEVAVGAGKMNTELAQAQALVKSEYSG